MEQACSATDLIQHLLLAGQVKETVDHRQHSPLISGQQAVDLLKKIENVIALHTAGDAGEHL